ncbi:MAG: TraB/GumN family protein [Thermoplasmata archaeon]
MYSSTVESPVLLLGAAHVVDLEAPLRRVLEERTLDGVAIELDAERAASLFSEGAPGRSSRGAPLFARIWGRVQRRLGAEIGGGEPGAEMKVAAALAKERNLPLFLIDDPIRATLMELVRTMPFKERVTLFVGAVAALFVPARLVEREMDRYASEPTAYTEELRRASPTIARVLLDERNEHMADRLATLRRKGYGRMAVVVGDAHLDGLRRALGRRGVPVESIPFQQLRGTVHPGLLGVLG